MITQERLKELFNYDQETGLFTWIAKSRTIGGLKAGSLTGQTPNSNGYLRISVDSKRDYAHRMAWLYVYGDYPKFDIDHINGNRSDNRIVNLRDVPHIVNSQNLRSATKTNTIGYMGITWSNYAKAWSSAVTVNGKRIHIGYFKDPEKAHQAYLSLKRKVHEGCTI